MSPRVYVSTGLTAAEAGIRVAEVTPVCLTCGSRLVEPFPRDPLYGRSLEQCSSPTCPGHVVHPLRRDPTAPAPPTPSPTYSTNQRQAQRRAWKLRPKKPLPVTPPDAP